MRIILNSKQSQTSDQYNIRVSFPVSFLCKKIYLSSVSIPYSFYNIRDSNNRVVIDGIEREIESKNYNSIQLASELSTLLPNDCFCEFDKQKIKYRIVNNSISTVIVRFTTSHRVFGFPENIDYFIESSDSIESPFIGDITDGLQALILTSNISTPFSTVFNQSFGTNIIARIPLAGVKVGDTIQFENRFNRQEIVKNFVLDYAEFRLLDDNLNPIKLNGVEMQIELFCELQNKNQIIDRFREKK